MKKILLAFLLFPSLAFADLSDYDDLCESGIPLFFVNDFQGNKIANCNTWAQCASLHYDATFIPFSEDTYSWEMGDPYNGDDDSVNYPIRRTTLSSGVTVTYFTRLASIGHTCGENPCEDFEGNEISVSLVAENQPIGCVSGCQVDANPPNFKNVKVKIGNGDTPWFTLGKYNGQTCSGNEGVGWSETITQTEAELQGINQQVSMSIVDGVPTFTHANQPNPLAFISEAGDEELEAEINRLNKQSYADVTNSTVNGQTNDAVISDNPITTDSDGNPPIQYVVSGVTSTVTGATDLKYNVLVGNTRTDGSTVGGDTGGNNGDNTGGSNDNNTGGDNGTGETDLSGVEGRLDSLIDQMTVNASGVVLSDSCEVEPVCEADKYYCQIVMQEWILKCSTYSQEKEYINTVADSEIDADGNGDASTDWDLSGMISSITQSELNGYCPSDYSLNVLGSSYNVSYYAYCDFATQIRPLVLVIGFFFVIIIVSRSF